MAISRNKFTCCGCSACEVICPRNAIKMSSDSLGFRFPIVDYEKCVECGMCKRVCQFSSSYNRFRQWNYPENYLARLKDNIQLSKSQSGGVFFGIAKKFIENGGKVYGAAFSTDFSIQHSMVEEIKYLDKLRMSKYVQSNIRDTYKQIKEYLQGGDRILFSGTPCQVAAMKSYIPKSLHDNLYCVDIICHGVPSPKLWKDYIHFIESKYNSKIVKVCFRDKRFGWHGATESYLLKNGDEVFRKTFNRLYFDHYSIRDCCSKCPFTNTKRVGDISLGDFWGLPPKSKYEDGLGVSLVFINSDKGINLFSSIRHQIESEKKLLELCLQPQLINPIRLNKRRDQFIKDYSLYGFEYIAKKYGDIGWRYKLSQYVNTFKNNIKQLLYK